MSHRLMPRRVLAAATATGLVVALAVAAGPATIATAATLTTAWQSGAFAENTAGVVGRSDIVLGQANTAATQYLPLGNGSLGVAEWAANGFTAQLNRSDTMPDRKSPGQVAIPGLAALTSAADFTATLDIYNGVLTESGGGMTAKIWVAANKDELIVDVTGANPATTQTASVNLWSGRSPAAAASGAIATLAETWVDNTEGSGTSGLTFGSLAAITAGGQGVTTSVVNSTTIEASFKPNADGTFRVVVGAPTWTGGNAATTASSLLGSDATAAESSLLSTQSAHWNGFWAASGLMEISSPDGSGEYMESLRAIYMYDEAASMSGTSAYGGSQAGVADMFNFDQDHQDWFPAGFWLWNLRAEIATNMSDGDFAENVPIFNMYLNDVSALQTWTKAQMGNRSGICVPETMRFNGNGYYGGSASNASCSLAASPSYNAENVTSGAEIALWIWQQYQDTGSLAFLQKYYPVMQQAATFLLAYQTVGSDGFLHATANAHETQWAVTDPTTDLAADAALFSATVSAATLLNTDTSLVSQLRTAENQIEPYSRTDAATHQQLLTPSSDAGGTDVISDSFQPTATLRNDENIGLEPVWPYGLIGDNSTLTGLADRTYTSRPNVYGNDWSMDAVDAARLDMASQVQTDLVQITERNQAFIAGTASLGGTTPGDEPYLEQSATVGTALNEALATDYDGVLRIAPAWPSAWNVAGTVYIRGGSKVDVQVQGGTITTAALIAGTTGTMTVRNPFASTEVVNGSSGAVVVAPTTASTFAMPVTAGTSYLIENTAALTTSYTFAQVTGSVATTDKHLGPVQLGLDSSAHYASLAASFNDVGITADTNTNPGNFDGSSASYSETALTNAGAGPGATVTSSGMTFTMPTVAGSVADNTVANGQVITVTGSGPQLGFLTSSSYGSASGTGTITYSDGTTQSYTLSTSDWWNTTAPSGGAVAVTSTYQNRPGNTTYAHTADLFSSTVSLNPAKTVASVTLPALGPLVGGTAALHVFAIAPPTGTSLAAAFNDVGISADTNTAPGNFDGGGASYSQTAMTNAGAGPGAAITASGHHFTVPNVAAGSADNVVANGQRINISGTAGTLGFLISGSYGPATGTGTVTYTDGTTQSYSLSAPDWFSTTPPSGGAVAVTSTYQNRQGNTTYVHTADVFSVTVAVNSAKTVASVTLPALGALASGTPALHVWAISLS